MRRRRGRSTRRCRCIEQVVAKVHHDDLAGRDVDLRVIRCRRSVSRWIDLDQRVLSRRQPGEAVIPIPQRRVSVHQPAVVVQIHHRAGQSRLAGVPYAVARDVQPYVPFDRSRRRRARHRGRWRARRRVRRREGLCGSRRSRCRRCWRPRLAWLPGPGRGRSARRGCRWGRMRAKYTDALRPSLAVAKWSAAATG